MKSCSREAHLGCICASVSSSQEGKLSASQSNMCIVSDCRPNAIVYLHVSNGSSCFGKNSCSKSGLQVVVFLKTEGSGDSVEK